MNKKVASAIGTLEDLLSQVCPQNVAALGQKSASEGKDPGRVSPEETTHPVQGEENNEISSSTGAQAAKNTAKIKEEQPLGVDHRPDLGEAKSAFDFFSQFSRKKATASGPATSPGSAEADQIQMGIHKAPTMEEPEASTEKSKDVYKDTDRGTAHPARSDNTSLDGKKYASATAEMPFETLMGLYKEASEKLLAKMVGEPHEPATQKSAAEQGSANAAYLSGWSMAQDQSGRPFDKRAADALVEERLASICRAAEEDAVYACNIIDQFEKSAAARAKAAADGDDDGGEEGHKKPKGESGSDDSSSGSPFPKKDSGGEGPPPDPTAGGGESGGGGGAMSGDDIMSSVAPQGGGGGGGGEQEAQQLLQFLISQGIQPEQIAQAVMGMVGGGGGGAGGPPGAGAGGPPPDMGGGMGGGGGAPPPMDPTMGGGGGMPGGPPKMAADKAAISKDAQERLGYSRSYLQELQTRSARAA